MFANTAPSGASGGVIGLHNLHNSGTSLGSLGAHPNTHTPQQLPQLQQQSSTPTAPSGTSAVGSNSGGPATGDLNGVQPSRRPSGLPLYNIAAQNGLPHYPGYGQSSTAPLPPGGPAAPIHPSHTLQRTASCSFNSPHLPSQHLLSTPASAPPSATLPPPNRSPSMSAPPHNPQAPANPAHSQGRSSLPTSLPGQCASNVNATLTSSDFSQAQPVPTIARAVTFTDAIPPSGSAAKRNPSNGACHSPGQLSNLGVSGHPPAGSQPGPSSMGVSSAPGCESSSSDASRFFNTYLYDYLLKQGLFEVAQVFVTSGAEIELMENVERSGSAEMPHMASSQKQDRSDSSPNGGPSSSPPQPTSNGCLTQAGVPNGIMKKSTAASEPIANERTLSSSGSTVSNTSHYGFTYIAGNRSGATNDGSNGQSAIADQATNGASASAGTSNTSMGSPRSSPRVRHLTLENLPKPKLAMDTDQGFLFEWWTIFWDVFRAKTGRGSNTQPAQMYAHSVAAASLGMSLEAGTPKARRDAVGLVAVANPDIQKGHLAARMQQPYTLMDSQMHLHAEHPTASAVRLQPHPHMTPQQKHQLMLEHNARQHQQQVLLQQQQQHIHQQQLQHHQAQMAARQRLYQHELQQQQQQEAHLQQQQQSHQQQQQHHQAQQLHQQMYSEQFPGGQMSALHRQMSINGRRVAGMGPQDHLSSMMPPPPVQHGSPLNPHQQPPYRPSRPPSRSGVPHVSSPFAGNAGQPPREPSRASNHANSPAAFQNNPRRPGSHGSASTPQTAVLPPHRRGSPSAAEDQDRKKRRLNDNPGHQFAESPHGNNQSQQAQQAQQRMQQMQQMQQMQHMQQAQHRQQMMGSNASTPVPASQGSPPNMNNTPHQNMDAYKQSVHAHHAQVTAGPNVANQTDGTGPNPAGNMTPAKANGAKLAENTMPPPAGRNFHRPPTPQATPNGTRPGDEHATPLPTIVTPSPDRSQSNQSNRLVNPPEGKTEASEGTPHQPSPMALPPGQISDDSEVPGNGDASGRPNGNSDETPSQGDIKVQQSTHQGNQDLWLMGNSQGTQQMKGMLGESSDSPTNAHPSSDIAVSSNNPIEQLFNGDGLNGDTSGLDFDATLFEAFINYDPTATPAEFS